MKKISNSFYIVFKHPKFSGDVCLLKNKFYSTKISKNKTLIGGFGVDPVKKY